MEVVKAGTNYMFLEDGNNAYCFSYGKRVAAIIDGEYVEYEGDRFNSVTSKKHKGMFRKHYGRDEKRK